MKESVHTFIYAAALGLVCALLLTATGRFTAPYRRANAEAEEVRNILAVLEVPFEPDASSQELLELFQRHVRVQQRGELPMYLYEDAGAERGLRAVAVRFAGQGLWGPIKGFLALEPDLRTIRGITFYQQEETPGLGGEIASLSFRTQFKGKRIEDAKQERGIRIVRASEADGINEVDAITGATMTCDRVERMLNAVIASIPRELSEDVH